MPCGFVPPYLLRRLADSADETLRGCGHRTQLIDLQLRQRRTEAPATATAPTGLDWRVHSADNTADLPGRLVRSAGEPESGDAAVDEAALGVGESLALLEQLGRHSYDGAGATVVATVHYERDYDNAFWDGHQLVLGDGDQVVFDRFTKPIDVLAHELGHAVTQYTAGLVYQGEPGALNESISDVLGACVKQRHLGQDAGSADWLIGEGLFLPSVNARGLRSMKDPGSAYDDPRLGRDPQVATMSAYVETLEDNGGVHLNSGIPNRAFHLAATAIGGAAWEGAGRIWYAALTSGLSSSTTFAEFAEATIAAAGRHADVVRDAWAQVEVGGAAAAPPAAAPAGGGQTLVVRRTGGFAGVPREGRLDLGSGDPRAREAGELLDRIDPAAVDAAEPGPDRFVYELRCATLQLRVAEPALTPELRRLVDLVLG